MEILVTGNLKSITDQFFDRISKQHKIVIYAKQKKKWKTRKKVISYPYRKEEDALPKIFDVFNFDSVVYFSESVDGNTKINDEIKSLENIISCSKEHQIKHFYFITSNDFCTEYEKINTEEMGIRKIILKACEDICFDVSKEREIQVNILRIPYIYTLSKAKNYVNSCVKKVLSEQKVTFSGTFGVKTDFLCDEDFGILMDRMFDEPSEEAFEVWNIAGNNAMSMGAFEEIIKKNISFESSYSPKDYAIPGQFEGNEVRIKYGWNQSHSLQEDICQIVEKIKAELEKEKKKIKPRDDSIKQKLRMWLEIILLFSAGTWLNHTFSNNVLLNFIDFNMLCVVIVGFMNGLKAGIIGAIFASIGYVLNATTVDWRIIFYNVQNWLPFACYFLLGTMLGYKCDKYEDSIQFAQEEHDILEEKYVFLSDLYQKVLENKNEFNNQIIGYQNSFGRIYNVVKKLDTVLPDKVFLESVNILEDILGNAYVAIYTTNNQSDFIRLNVCSKSLTAQLSKSLKLSNYPEMKRLLQEQQIFINKNKLKDYPAYAAPIIHDDQLMGAIVLQYAETKHMNTEFSNKFQMIADLIHNSLMRAMEYEHMLEQENTIENTKIIKPEKFEEILELREQMKEKEYLDYVLLRLEVERENMEEFSNTISSLIRANDTIGQRADGKIYLLLSQTKDTELNIIKERMDSHGIAIEVIEG